MGRVCAVCQAIAHEGLAVFPFPRCQRQQHSWLTSLPSLRAIWERSQMPSSQLGICEQHFLPGDVRRHAGRVSLARRAVPVKVTHQTHATLAFNTSGDRAGKDAPTEDYVKGRADEEKRKDRGIKWRVFQDQQRNSNDCLDDDQSSYLPQELSPAGSWEAEHSEKSMKGNSAKSMCLLCGEESSSRGLVCVLSVQVLASNVSLGVLVARIVGRSKREVTCMSVKICSQCRSLVEEVAQIEDELKAKKQVIKDKFEGTFQNQREECKVMPNSPCKYTKSSEVYPYVGSNTPLLTYDSVESPNKDDTGDYVPDKSDDDSRKTCRRQASLKKYCCPQCQEEYTSLALWVHHLSKHSDAEDPVIQNKTKSVVSKTKKSKIGNYTCKECGKTFACKQTLMGHLSTHQKGCDCSVCGRYLTTWARLKAHLFKFHGIGKERDKEVECQDCGKLFGTKAGLRYHRNVIHHVGPKYVCEQCRKVFHYHVPYRSHMLYSHGEKKIVCETCGEKFFTISKLNTHINAVHREAQTWMCDKCDDKFTTHTAFRHHMNMKHLRVNHTCSYCSAQFRKRTFLLLHLWKHSIYICHLCQDNFSCGTDLRTHMSVTHGKDMIVKGKKKQSSQHTQSKKLVAPEEVVMSKTAVSDGHIQQSEHVASIVINNLLMTTESYENPSLPPFSLATCEKLPEKDAFSNDEDIKVKTLSMIDTSQQLPDTDSVAFRTGDALEVKSDHIEMTSRHIEMSPEHIEMTSNQLEMSSDHIEMPTEHIEMASDHIKMGSEHIEIGSEHIEMAPGVSLINVQILGGMEMAEGSEDTLASEDMLANAAHHLAIPPLDSHLTQELGASAHTLEIAGPALEGPSHALESPSHTLDAADHTLQSPSHTLDHLESTGSPHQSLPSPPTHLPGPLPTVISQMETKEKAEAEEGSGESLEEKMELAPFSVSLGGKGEVKYQYVMYITPAEDTNPG